MTVITGDILDEKKKDSVTIPENTDGQDSLNLIPPKKSFVVRVFPKRHALSTPAQRLLSLLFSVAVLVCSCIVGYMLFRHFFPVGYRGRYTGFCNVMVPEQHAHFREQFEMDRESELMQIPAFDVYEGVSVLHLFGKRKTVIRTAKECYIKPMRPNLRPPVNMEDLIQKFVSGEYVPSAHLISQRWYVKHPRIPNHLIGFIFNKRAATLCGDLPTYELVPRPNVICPAFKCMECKPGKVRRINQIGCPTCECVDHQDGVYHKIYKCPGEPDVCPRVCRFGHETGPGGCELCQCRILATRRKRSPNNCDVRSILFEGVAPGDETEQAPINYIIDCNK